MLKIGFLSPTSHSGKTSAVIGLIDALASDGDNIMFINFNNLCNDNDILIPFCNGTLFEFLNKKIKLQEIITHNYDMNFDFITVLSSDWKLIHLMDENGIKTATMNLNKSIVNLKKYDYLIINFLDDKMTALNKILINECDILILIINPLEFDSNIIIKIHTYIKFLNEKKKFNNIHILFNKFKSFSKKTNENIEQIRLSFGESILINYHIPYVQDYSNFDIYLKKLQPIFKKITNHFKDKIFKIST